jgi:hypothetical protein
MSGQWSGGAANRTWARPGVRTRGDPAVAAALYEALKDTRFWCDNCGSMHPLREHRNCRAQHPFQTAFRGAA